MAYYARIGSMPYDVDECVFHMNQLVKFARYYNVLMWKAEMRGDKERFKFRHYKKNYMSRARDLHNQIQELKK